MLPTLTLTAAIFMTASACSSMGSCGGGCRARARAAGRVDAHGKPLPGYVPGLEAWNANKSDKAAARLQRMSVNDLFAECCSERGLPSACINRCHFDRYDERLLMSASSGLDECPLSALSDMHFCAAQGGDHRECCRARGVTQTLAGEKCLIFCDQRPGEVTQLDYSFLPCFTRFGEMKQCFVKNIGDAARRRFF